MSAENSSNPKIRISLFDAVEAKSVEVQWLTPAGLVDFISGTEGFAKVHLPLLKLGLFGDHRSRKGSLRHDRNLHFISGVELDYDGGFVSFEDALATAEKQPLLSILYTSPSHTPARPRWRLLAPTSQEYPTKDRTRFVERINGAYGGIFTSESWTVSQSFYFGRIVGDPNFRIALIEGEAVDELHELDLIARGKTRGAVAGNGNSFEGSTAGLAEAALEELIRSGEHYHETTLRLATIAARRGDDQGEAEDRILDLFEEVAAEKQDRERWARRKGEVHRCVTDMYLRHARELEEAEERQAAALTDLENRGGPAPNGHDSDPLTNLTGGASNLSDGTSGEDFPGDRATQAQHHWGNGEADLSFRDPWDDPLSPEWPPGVLPTWLHDMLFEISLRDGLDPGSQGMTLLAAVSGAAPKNARFFPYAGNRKWWVPPIIWVMIVNLSGQRKTALLDNAFTAVRARHTELWRAYMAEMKQWRATPVNERGDQPEEPHSFYVEDVTPEKLQMILAETERGTLLLRDELAGIFDFGRYAQGQGATERAFYLQSYEAGPYTVHRVKRDSLYVAVSGLTVYGHIQPDRVKNFTADLESDGLLQRFITVCGGRASAGRALDVTQKQADFDAIVDELCGLRGVDYRTTPEGGEIIRQMERDGSEYATITDYGVGFQGFCGKLHGTLARVALILHLIDNPMPAAGAQTIPLATIERADRLVRRFVLLHAVDFYAGLSSDRIERTRAIAAWLLTASPPRLRASDFTSYVRPCRGLSLAELNEALDPLVTGGWLIPKEPFPSNREWTLVVDVRTALASRHETAAARREEIRQLWKKIASERSGGGRDADL